jgi:hypothetical protein
MISVFSGLILFFPADAQRMVSEGRMEYKVTPMAQPGYESLAASFGTSKQLVWLKGKDCRIDFESMHVRQSVFINLSDKINLLREAGEERFRWTFDSVEWKRTQKKFEGAKWIELNESKDIDGFFCRKALIELSDSSVITLFYTNQYRLLNPAFDPVFSLAPGLPVLYSVVMSGLQLEYRLSSLQTIPVSSSVFEVPISGYKIIKAPLKEPF